LVLLLDVLRADFDTGSPQIARRSRRARSEGPKVTRAPPRCKRVNRLSFPAREGARPKPWSGQGMDEFPLLRAAAG
jgi:hypothetical protein